MRWLGLILGLLLAQGLSAAEVTQVTTYITTVQKERESTRFTLTEWLRIKERMKMMDVWLAMFSNPQAAFKPELGLYYGQNQSLVSLTGFTALAASPTSYEKKDTVGTNEQVQLWLTNLISSTFGVRTLNVDLGLEFRQNEQVMSFADKERRDVVRQFGVDFRVFGQHIQDSLFVLKAGKFESVFDDLLLVHPSGRDFTGNYYGGEMQLYLFPWLALKGEYTSFGEVEKDDLKLSGLAYDYGAFIEISLFRFAGAICGSAWSYQDAAGQKAKKTLDGKCVQVSLHF